MTLSILFIPMTGTLKMANLSVPTLPLTQSPIFPSPISLLLLSPSLFTNPSSITNVIYFISPSSLSFFLPFPFPSSFPSLPFPSLPFPFLLPSFSLPFPSLSFSLPFPSPSLLFPSSFPFPSFSFPFLPFPSFPFSSAFLFFPLPLLLSLIHFYSPFPSFPFSASFYHYRKPFLLFTGNSSIYLYIYSSWVHLPISLPLISLHNILLPGRNDQF